MKRKPALSQNDVRVLLLPPTERDAAALEALLMAHTVTCVKCESIDGLCDALDERAGAILIAEEILTAAPERFTSCIRSQPFWSDLPIIVLARSGLEPPQLAAILSMLGHVTVVERPVRMTTMLSLVRSCLRTRERQYQLRDHLALLTIADSNLRESEERLRLATQTGKLGVWELDLKTNAMQCSPVCKALHGRGPDDPLSYGDLAPFVHPEDIAQLQAALGAAALKLQSFEVEFRSVWPDGSHHWLLTRGSSSAEATEAASRLVGVTLDITERKTSEMQRASLLESERAAREEAERAGRMKDEFLATLSHELRTPLSAILGWSQILRRGAKAEVMNDGLATIERNARAQTQIIEDLLDMSRIISGKVALDAQSIDAADVIRAAIETVRATAVAKSIAVVFAASLSDRYPVTGDFNRLQQVFWNLMSNAIKFTPRGGAISISIGQRDSLWQVDLTDTGEGMPSEFLPYVFDRFRQADASTTRKHGGLGLGLSIVKQLIELHGGTVRARSDGAGKGSTFTVSLPVRPLHDQNSNNVSGTASTGEDPDISGVTLMREGATWDASLCNEIRGRRLLIVDDEPDARALLKQLLCDCGADVIVAATAEETIACIQRDRPDVLVSDIGMPLVDGYELIKRIRALPAERGGRTPAIALTAYARAEDRMRAVRAGFQTHVPKPVDPAELITMIAAIVGDSDRR